MDQDSDVLLNIFPGEVWMNVFEISAHYKHLDDIENAINSSLYFRNLLKYKITTLLIPKVFPILYPNLFEDENNEDCDFSEDESEEDEHELDNSEYSNLLRMRLTCKSWKNTVNDYHQNLSHHYKFVDDPCQLTPRYSGHYGTEEEGIFEQCVYYGDEWCVEKFGNSSHALRFIEHYNQTHYLSNISANPFIGRSIEIGKKFGPFVFKEPREEEVYLFWNAITEILEKYGTFIWYCKICVKDFSEYRVNYYRRIKQWLELMPNLKVLKISYKILNGDEENCRLNDEILGNPLCYLKKLTCLKTENIPAPLLHELVKRNAVNIQLLQIKKLECVKECDPFIVSLPKLKELSVNIKTLKEITKLSESGVCENLETLYLDLVYNWKFKSLTWKVIFNFFQDMRANILENLMISLPLTKTDGERQEVLEICESDSFKLELPKVKRVKLLLFQNTPVDFLLQMRNSLEVLEIAFFDKLEKLKRATRYGDKDDGKNLLWKEQVKLFRFETGIYDSNVWELLPKLERVQVCAGYSRDEDSPNIHKVYTRQTWKSKMLEKGSQ